MSSPHADLPKLASLGHVAIGGICLAFIGDTRRSDSPFVDTIWRARSERAGSFISAATNRWEMVVTRHHDRSLTLTVRGPETVATPASFPADGDWFGISFKIGSQLSLFPVSNLVDRSVDLPAAGTRSFWLHGAAWSFPDYENADTFVDRLVREGLLIHEPMIEAALQGTLKGVSERSVQRRFMQTTGLTQSMVRQIDRA